MENIALGFSGGGFRAAAFSLGSISYLNHVPYKGKPLLQNVKFISSTSGGSITNLAYSAFLFQDKSFTVCYNHLMELLDGEKLIANAVAITKAIQYRANNFTRDNSAKDLLEDKTFKESFHFGIMDGGITDNQGIDSFQLANSRRVKNSLPPFSLFISCDVTSFLLNGYSLPLEKRNWYNQVTIQQVINFIKVLALLFPVLLLLKWFVGWYSGLYILVALSFMALLVYSYGTWQYMKQKKQAKEKQNTWGVILFKYIDTFLLIRMSAIIQMVKARTKSVSLLSSEIYLKQIRRMYYDSLFTSPKYRDISIANTIHDLSRVSFSEGFVPDDVLAPTVEMIEVAEKARTMGTTLWFDAHHQSIGIKEAVIATGQFTICYNLLRYLNKVENTASGWTPELEVLRTALLEDWGRFKGDPYFLCKRLRKK